MTDVGVGAEQHASLGISCVSFDLQSVTKLRIKLKALECKVINKLESEPDTALLPFIMPMARTAQFQFSHDMKCSSRST